MEPEHFYATARKAADISRFSLLKARDDKALQEDVDRYLQTKRWDRETRLLNAAAAIITELTRMELEGVLSK
nr:MAG TPA: hypothetical protein [Caudoviricetes sp.]